MRKHSIGWIVHLFLLFIPFCLIGQEGYLKLQDIWGSPLLMARGAGGFNAMADGEHYTLSVESENGQFIVKYRFSSGLPVDTLLYPADLVSGTDTISFSDYDFSPDGSRILLITGREAIYRHSTREDYYLFDRPSGLFTRITEKGKAMYARFSPDGKRLAYVRENNIYMYDISSGKETAVTTDGRKNEIINGATDWVYEEEFSMDIGFEWSPQGTHIAYFRFDETDVKEFNLTYYGGLYPKEERYKYPKAGEANSKVEVRVYNLQNAQTAVVFSTGDTWEYIPRIKWTARPGVLSYQRCNRHQNKLELILFDTNTGKSSTLLREENSSFIEVTDDLTYLKDGNGFIWTSSRDGFNHIYLYGMDGIEKKQITKGAFDVTKFYGYSEEKKLFYYQSTEKSPLERHVYSISMNGSSKLLTPESGTHNADFIKGLKYFTNTFSSFGIPYRCTLNDATGKEIRILEENKDVKLQLSKFRLGKLDTLSFLTDDGVRIFGWMILPPDFKENLTYPVLIHVYGGPGVQTVTNDWDGPNYLWHEMLAQRGYIVVSFDNRGTPGRGLEFANCIYKDMGRLEVMDQLNAVKFLKSKTYIDSNRIGVWGWSFGGYMTSLLMTKGMGAFKAGIAVAPVTTWRYYDSIYTERYLQTPQENPKGYDDNSPIRFADRLQGKFLLVHGSTDDNVHMQNTMDFITALVKANKPFDTFIYPNKNHGIGGGGTRLHLYGKMTDFIMQNL